MYCKHISYAFIFKEKKNYLNLNFFLYLNDFLATGARPHPVSVDTVIGQKR